MSIEQTSPSTAKAAWIEPEIVTLDVGETAGFRTRGGDGNIHLDCSRS